MTRKEQFLVHVRVWAQQRDNNQQLVDIYHRMYLSRSDRFGLDAKLDAMSAEIIEGTRRLYQLMVERSEYCQAKLNEVKP